MENEIPVLMYHEVNHSSAANALSGKIQHTFILSENQFETQMRFLAEEGYHSLLLDDLVTWMLNPDTGFLPEKPVVITFDDGYAGNFDFAFPVLYKHQFKATFFVITGRIGHETMMDWNQLKELSNKGMAIESHTVNHQLLGSISTDRMSKELKDSRGILEDNIGKTVKFLSLPFGSFNSEYRQVALDAGYEGGCTSQFGYTQKLADPYFIPRLQIKNTLNLDAFKKMVAQDKKYLSGIKLRTSLKSGVRKIVGEKFYNDFYNMVYGVKEKSLY